jgi:hypothetical protein
MRRAPGVRAGGRRTPSRKADKLEANRHSMVVRIKFRRGPKVGRRRRRNKRLALAIAALLPPLALTAGLLAIWRIAADLKLAGSFAIANGLFSHWHVWMGAAVLLQTCAFALNRYGKSEDPATS